MGGEQTCDVEVAGGSLDVAEVHNQYEWKMQFAQLDLFLGQTELFLKQGEGTNLAITTLELREIMELNTLLMEGVYRYLYPDRKMTYHDDKHAKATLFVAMKILLGKISAFVESGEATTGLDNNQLKAVLTMAAAVFANHEKGDWWKFQPNDKYEEGFYENLGKHGIRRKDFDRLIELDDFMKMPNETVKEFFDAGIDDFMPNLPKELRKPMVTMMAESIVAADFLQICNGSYSDEILVKVKGKVKKLWRGLVALAREFEIFRPKALKGAGWAKEDDPTKLDIEKVNWNEDFFRKTVLPRVLLGISGMWRFNSGEAKNIFRKLATLGSVFQNDY